MDGWSEDFPRIPGHYWVSVPGYERAPDIEDVGDGLVMRDSTGQWKAIEFVRRPA